MVITLPAPQPPDIPSEGLRAAGLIATDRRSVVDLDGTVRMGAVARVEGQEPTTPFVLPGTRSDAGEQLRLLRVELLGRDGAAVAEAGQLVDLGHGVGWRVARCFDQRGDKPIDNGGG